MPQFVRHNYFSFQYSRTGKGFYLYFFMPHIRRQILSTGKAFLPQIFMPHFVKQIFLSVNNEVPGEFFLWNVFASLHVFWGIFFFFQNLDKKALSNSESHSDTSSAHCTQFANTLWISVVGPIQIFVCEKKSEKRNHISHLHII